MDEDYISISTLNDFIFCPYSIYLHNVYMESDEGLYHATPQGAIRLQFSVYEVNNTQRIIDNIKINIVDKFSKLFTGADSVLIFDAPNAKVQKFGNAIHRDADIVYL